MYSAQTLPLLAQNIPPHSLVFLFVKAPAPSITTTGTLLPKTLDKSVAPPRPRLLSHPGFSTTPPTHVGPSTSSPSLLPRPSSASATPVDINPSEMDLLRYAVLDLSNIIKSNHTDTNQLLNHLRKDFSTVLTTITKSVDLLEDVVCPPQQKKK